MLGDVRRAAVAVTEARRALELDPLSLASWYFLSLVLCFARRFEESITEARAGLELDATYHLLYLPLGWALAGWGRRDEAVETLRQATILAPGLTRHWPPVARASSVRHCHPPP